MKSAAFELVRQFPGNATDAWPMGERPIPGMTVGSTPIGILAPRDGEPE
jgi:hypothetical protein